MTSTILIVTAMLEEMEHLKKWLIHSQEKVVGAYTFHESHHAGFNIITAICGIGKVNAAVCTTLAYTLYNPDLVVNIGVAGGLHHELQVGDVVVAKELIYHDADATAFGYSYGQIPRMPAFYQAEQILIDLTMNSNKKYAFKLSLGLICSGDSFVSDTDIVIKVQGKIPDILGIDMESCAIAQACHQLAVPFYCLRSISDAANDTAKQSYETNLVIAVDNVTNVLLDLLISYRHSLDNPAELVI